MSLAKDFPNKPNGNVWKVEIKDEEKKEKEEKEWRIIDYNTYSQDIENLFNISGNSLTSLIIKDYRGFVSALCTLAEEWKQLYEEKKKFLHFEWNKNDKDRYIRVNFEEEYEKARTFRIHDLYQKLKYSYLCTVLYDKVKNLDCVKEKKIEVYPTNQNGLFKKDDKKAKDYICVNYTYLHGEPLLEINIHPMCCNDDKYEIDYVIQVQGGVYEHGFGVKKFKEGKTEKVTAAEVWKELSINNRDPKFSNAEKWMRTPRMRDEEAEWYKDSDAEKVLEDVILPTRENPQNDMLTETIKNGKKVKIKYGYNKYDMKGTGTTYIYQSRRIKNEATIVDVLSLMIKDVEKVIGFISES